MMKSLERKGIDMTIKDIMRDINLQEMQKKLLNNGYKAFVLERKKMNRR